MQPSSEASSSAGLMRHIEVVVQQRQTFLHHFSTHYEAKGLTICSCLTVNAPRVCPTAKATIPSAPIEVFKERSLSPLQLVQLQPTACKKRNLGTTCTSAMPTDLQTAPWAVDGSQWHQLHVYISTYTFDTLVNRIDESLCTTFALTRCAHHPQVYSSSQCPTTCQLRTILQIRLWQLVL